jgi:hypothetical protein
MSIKRLLTGFRLGTLWLVVLFASPGQAQNVFQADAEYQALTYTDEAGYKGCGIRALVLHQTELPEIVGADLSVNVYFRPVLAGIVKASYLTANPPAIKKIQPARFSISLEQDGVPLRLLQLQPAEDPGYLFSPTEESPTAKVLLAMFNGDRVVVSLLNEGEKTERRFVFAAKLSAGDHETFSACLRALLAAS